MGNGALPNGSSYRAHPRLYQNGHAMHVAACPLLGQQRKSNFSFAFGLPAAAGAGVVLAGATSQPGASRPSCTSGKPTARRGRERMSSARGAARKDQRHAWPCIASIRFPANWRRASSISRMRFLQPRAITRPSCACRKLNPGILVMQSAQGWATKNVPGAIDGARDRCILLQG